MASLIITLAFGLLLYFIFIQLMSVNSNLERISDQLRNITKSKDLNSTEEVEEVSNTPEQ